MFEIALSFLMAFTMVYAILPAAIRIAINKRLTAKPGERHAHTNSVPSIGGVPVFFGVLFTVLLLTPDAMWETLRYILAALLLVFLLGLKDDITELSARSKILGLLFAILIVVVKGDISLNCLYGLGYSDAIFPNWLSTVVSCFTLLVITNSFNLIDGINGLLGTVGILVCAVFGTWFFVVDLTFLGVIALATAGSLLAFLRFNVTPSQTIMGDTGSLVVGLLAGILTIEFIDRASGADIPDEYAFAHPIAVAVATLIVPLFDTVRVFFTRMMRGHSPFQPDRRHIHHLLIDYGFNHEAATGILAIVTMLFVSFTFLADSILDLHYILGLQLGSALLLTFVLHKKVVVVNQRNSTSSREEGRRERVPSTEVA